MGINTVIIPVLQTRRLEVAEKCGGVADSSCSHHKGAGESQSRGSPAPFTFQFVQKDWTGGGGIPITSLRNPKEEGAPKGEEREPGRG